MNREIFGSLDHCTFYMFNRSMGQYSDIACVASNNVGDMMFPCLYRIVEPSKSLCRTRPTEPWRFHCQSILSVQILYLFEFCHKSYSCRPTRNSTQLFCEDIEPNIRPNRVHSGI